MKYQNLFSEKENKKNILKYRLLKLYSACQVLKFNGIMLTTQKPPRSHSDIAEGIYHRSTVLTLCMYQYNVTMHYFKDRFSFYTGI